MTFLLKRVLRRTTTLNQYVFSPFFPIALLFDYLWPPLFHANPNCRQEKIKAGDVVLNEQNIKLLKLDASDSATGNCIIYFRYCFFHVP
jgi:hypothetical protein